MMNETLSMYIDPATTSLIIQIAAGVVITAGTFLGIFWSKIKRVFKKNKDDEADTIKAADMKSLQEGEKDVITADDLLADDDDEN